MTRAPAVVVVCLLVLVGPPAAACASSIAALRELTSDPAFPLHWIETGMDDGKPLHFMLEDRSRALYLRFDKSGEGLWAEGLGVICRTASGLEARFGPGQLRTGPAAGWLLRSRLQSGGRFDLVQPAQGQLHVGTFGWQGRFSAAEARP